jgi:MFS transporter, OFA family, oxalate/formate antiporter
MVSSAGEIRAPAAADRWAVFAVISAIFFLICGGTFSSLGIILPFMIEELSWSWSQAGTGFSLFALTVGIASTVPAWILRRFGIKATYGAGGAVMVAGFGLLALTNGFYLYLVAAALLGLGFASCATVPAVHLLTGWMPERRSAAIGAFMTIGGLGAVAGPLLASGTVAATGSWRFYWWALAATLLVLTALALVFVKGPPERASESSADGARAVEGGSSRVYRTQRDWRFRDAVRTSQYWVISLAMTAILLCVLTANSWVVTHLGTLGISTAIGAGVLSAGGAVSALSRAVGGALATRIDPKWLLVAALAGEVIGMAALSVADNWVALVIFATAEGFGFGMCFFATAILLVNYFGPGENPEIYGTFNLITTAAMVGPALAGFVADRFGGFAEVFQAYAVALLAMLAVTAMMRPPRERPDARSTC